MNNQTNVAATPLQPIVIPPLPFAPYYDAGGITIYNMDCRKVLPWLERFDLLLTDPPYGIGADKMTLGNGKRKIYRGNEEWDSKPPARWQIEQMVEMANHAILWGGNYFALPETRCVLVWDKGTGDNDFADCELAWTNLDKVVKKHFQSWVGANAKDKDGARVHPTQKPLALMRWCLSLVPEAQTVLDPYMGSGTTLLACKLEGRKAVLIEAVEAYCESAAKRLSQGVLF
jgi:DNA modification methylase